MWKQKSDSWENDINSGQDIETDVFLSEKALYSEISNSFTWVTWGKKTVRVFKVGCMNPKQMDKIKKLITFISRWIFRVAENWACFKVWQWSSVRIERLSKAVAYHCHHDNQQFEVLQLRPWFCFCFFVPLDCPKVVQSTWLAKDLWGNIQMLSIFPAGSNKADISCLFILVILSFLRKIFFCVNKF